MRNTVRLGLALVVVGLFISSMAYAGYGSEPTSTEQKKPAAVDVGNEICPVTGDKVDGVHFYEYKGKRYGLCCPKCITIFANDPVKYSAIADKEVAGKK